MCASVVNEQFYSYHIEKLRYQRYIYCLINTVRHCKNGLLLEYYRTKISGTERFNYQQGTYRNSLFDFTHFS